VRSQASFTRVTPVAFAVFAGLFLAANGCAKAPPSLAPLGGSGGAGGAGGSAVVNCGSENPDDLISDFKTDNGIDPVDGRSGGWYVYGDPTPTAAFDPPKNMDMTVPYPIDSTDGNHSCSGPGSLHVKGSGFQMWGAATATDFVPKITNAAGAKVKGTYDATKYKGVSFWAKAAAPVNFVQIKFNDVFSAAEADPTLLDPTYFSCTDGLCGFPNGCSPYIVKLSAPAGDPNYPKYVTTQIDTQWRRFDILFADAKQDKYCIGYNPIGMLDLKHLVGFAIQVNANFSVTPTTANDFEIWIDDVRFIPLVGSGGPNGAGGGGGMGGRATGGAGGNRMGA